MLGRLSWAYIPAPGPRDSIAPSVKLIRLSLLISIVCVYNKPEVLREYLLRGLARQSGRYQLITVDNTTGRFRSASAALNHGAAKATGDYIAFMHQDVQLLSPDWLIAAERLMRGHPDLGVAGVAGVRKPPSPGLLRIGSVTFDCRVYFVYQGVEKVRVPSPDPVMEVCEVQTLDEQVLIVPRQIVRLLPFDEKCCLGWDLYGVDYSLSVKQLNRKAYVLPLPVWHHSTGQITHQYFASLRSVLAKHHHEEIIGTTCGVWHTSVFLNCLGWMFMAIRSEIGRWLGRNQVGAAPFLRNIRALASQKG